MVLTESIENMEWEIHEDPIPNALDIGLSLAAPSHAEVGLENSLRNTWP